ncbi:MAG: hypothetical protein HFJ45_05375 [Clostridia bacterium]|nr:hypothetical protein [Clostridia bacterium]
MDKELYNKLDSLVTEYNVQIRSTFENGRPKIKLEDRINDIIMEYQRRLSNVFSMSEYGARLENYFEQELSGIKRDLRTRTSNTTYEVSDFLCKLNIKEFDRNIEVLEEKNADTELKSEGLKKNSDKKLNSIEEEKLGMSRDSQKEAYRTEQRLDQIVRDINVQARRIMAGNPDYLSISRLEAAMMQFNNITSFANKRFGEQYKDALNEYKESAYNAFGEINKYYENAVRSEALPELEISKDGEAKDNPFRVSEDIIRKIVDVGKAPTKVPERKPEERESHALPSDIL